MDRFELNETKGRDLLLSFLRQYTSDDQVKFTADKYNPVDVYFTLQDKRAVGEIKVRDQKYEGYYTHLIETRKLKAIIEKQKEHQCTYAFYFCFFGDDRLYIYNAADIVKHSWSDCRQMPLTTAQASGVVWKDCRQIPTRYATKFALDGGTWERL